MYLHTSIHRMSVPPPAVVLVSKIALAAVVTAIAAAFMIAPLCCVGRQQATPAIQR